MPKKYTHTNNVNDEVIILLHGLLASSLYWNRVGKRLKRKGYRVITPDLLGFGQATSETASRYDYDEHVAHLHEFIQKMNLSEPFMLGGHSMGALLAARYSLQYPAKVKQLLLFNPPLYQSHEQARATLRDTNWPYRFLLDSKFRNAGWLLIKKIPNRLIGDHSNAARELSLLNIIESAQFINDLEKIKTSTVLMIGKNDRPIYQKNVATIRLPNNVELMIEDVPHHSPILQPDLIVRIINTL